MKLVTDRKFLPLTPNEERTYGWVTVDNLLVTDFDVGTVTRGNWAALGLRIDKRRVNARLLRAHIELEITARHKAAIDAGHRFKLSRDERKQIREDLQTELLRQTSPSVDVVPVLMHTKRRVAHVLALSKGVNELAQAHFLDTFGVELMALTPWRRSQEMLEGTDQLAALEDIHRSDFTMHSLRGEGHSLRGDPAIESAGDPARFADRGVSTSKEVRQ